jgi:hypothetical protein
MRYDADHQEAREALQQEEAGVIRRALALANFDCGKLSRVQDVRALYRRLDVLPPGSRYCISNVGNVSFLPSRQKQEKNRKQRVGQPSNRKYSANTVLRWRKSLVRFLDAVSRDNLDVHIFKHDGGGGVLAEVREKVTESNSDVPLIRHKIRLKFTGEIWCRTVFDNNRVVPTTQRLVTPTLDTLVTYAAMLAASRRWRTRLGKCRECGQFFLVTNRKGGRRRLTCGSGCESKRRDATNRIRQQRFRERHRRP